MTHVNTPHVHCSFAASFIDFFFKQQHFGMVLPNTVYGCFPFVRTGRQDWSVCKQNVPIIGTFEGQVLS